MLFRSANQDQSTETHYDLAAVIATITTDEVSVDHPGSGWSGSSVGARICYYCCYQTVSGSISLRQSVVMDRTRDAARAERAGYCSLRPRSTNSQSGSPASRRSASVRTFQAKTTRIGAAGYARMA